MRSAARVAAEAPAEAEPVPLSEPQEYAFMPRREGDAWKPRQVDNAAQTLEEMLDDRESDAGLRAWRIGDKLSELYVGYAERVKHFASFAEYATTRFTLNEDEVYEFLRVRRRIENAAEATNLGRARIQLGFRLLDRLGIETFEALAERDLPLPDGTTCRFPAKVRQLQAALKLLKTPPVSTTGVSRDLKSEAVRRTEMLKLARQEDPDLAGIRVQFEPRDGDVFMKADSIGTAGSVALARLILRIEETMPSPREKKVRKRRQR